MSVAATRSLYTDGGDRITVAPFGERAVEITIGADGHGEHDPARGGGIPVWTARSAGEIDRRDARRARRLATMLGNTMPPSVRSIVPGYGVVLAHLDDDADAAAAADELARIVATFPAIARRSPRARDASFVGGARQADDDRSRRLHTVRAVYDGPDLAFVAEHAGLSVEEVARRHSAATYEVEMMGFLPGFAYLGGLDPTIAAPRLPAPRVRVDAGALGIAGTKTGIYPSPSPGGWRLVGRVVDIMLFDVGRDPVALLRPGHQVRFEIADVARR